MKTTDNLGEIATFNFYAPIEKAYQSDDGREWIVEGPLSNPEEDIEGEIMDSSGLLKGMQTFHRLNGPVDWDHNYARYGTPKWLIGKGLETFQRKHPRSEHVVPWLRTKLLQGKQVAQEAIEHLENGGSLGYSVYGGVKKRHGAVIEEPIISMVSLTPIPVVAENAGCVSLVKSLAGAGAWPAPGQPLWRVPELYDANLAGLVVKALQAAATPLKAGPGITAVGCADFAGDAEEEPQKKKKRTPRALRGEIEKALAQERRALLRRAAAALGEE